ncbi:proteinase-activated receptor 1 isoform X2 [Drosophila novamexicana]|uniref:proteinase-activated receptor 1 isoform X2 n=1 Tax=Drosophila novamexicana TaxID=47314 RepID=UPI0011E5F1FD|nr:proteinase-activated receptor 1 isoform X2 [Drosophila novamexicana]
MANPYEPTTMTAMSNTSQDISAATTTTTTTTTTATTATATTTLSYTTDSSRNISSELEYMSVEDEEMLHIAFLISDFVNRYYVPIICCTGSIGNILSVFVFFMTKLRKLSSSFYLAALAISDTCFLCGLFMQWLNFLNVNIYNQNYFCQFFTFISYLASFCSVWFVVAFTVERFIAVMYPLKRQIMCTVRRAKIVLLGLTLAGCVHCVPYILIAKPVYSPKLNDTICDLNTSYKGIQYQCVVQRPQVKLRQTVSFLFYRNTKGECQTIAKEAQSKRAHPSNIGYGRVRLVVTRTKKKEENSAHTKGKGPD